MLDERAFIARLEEAQAGDFADMLTQPSADEEKALRFHLGDKRYRRLHSMALKRSLRQEKPLGSVVIIHDLLGSSLSAVNRDSREPLWVNAVGIVGGNFERLRMADDGRTPFSLGHGRLHMANDERAALSSAHDIQATGMLKRHYGELLLSLSQRWNVRAFVYDWRKDLRIAADALNADMTEWFDDQDKPMHIVAHGMGGLVARVFISRYAQRWKECGGRLIMLGTPNYGSFVVPQIFMGVGAIVNMLGNLYGAEKNLDIVEILASFPSLYQMLPVAFSETDDDKSAAIVDSLFQLGTYGDYNIVQYHLAGAKELRKSIDKELDASSMICIAGYGQPTPVNIKDIEKFKALGGIRNHKRSSDSDLSMFEFTYRGDGFVPCERALLYEPAPNGKPKKNVPIGQWYYVEETHGGLTSSKQVLAAIDELLECAALDGTHGGLTSNTQVPATTDALAKALDGTSGEWSAQDRDHDGFSDFVSRARTRGAAATLGPYISYRERMVEEQLTRHLLATDYDDERRPVTHQPTFQMAKIDIVVAHGNIAMIPDEQLKSIDAIAIGHYLGVMPQGAMRDLDESLSLASVKKAAVDPPKRLKRSDLLLTQLSERGTIRGDLGQPFFLPDPRQAASPTGPGTDDKVLPQRVIAIAGMGVPGRFGVPELTVLVRELCWALGRIGKRHLAVVLIGAGRGNLPEEDAIFAWIRGIKHAITGSAEGSDRHLQQVTFVEIDPIKVKKIESSIRAEATQLRSRNRLDIGPVPRGEPQEWAFDETASEHTMSNEESKLDMPTRLTVGWKQGIYRFGAITQDASVPEREIQIDKALIDQANDELAAEWDLRKQLERGRFLGGLLVPQDLRTQLSGTAPVVVLLDATTARIHWEGIAQRVLTTPEGARLDDQGQSDEEIGYFLGTTRGLTRQLRTTFSPPPEPPPPPRRVLRVLIIADPAADAHLPGAQEEGVEVSELFESYNKVYATGGANRIQVLSLIGPSDATRTTVLREVMLHSYDVLHFAGHCTYVENDASRSGWVFSNGELITANELKRIDRIPKFIFSNACQSGITPDRSEERSVGLAPSFAEAFFQQGVTNFVCTAWPVNDAAARTFAIELYSRLIGLQHKKPGIGFEERNEKPKYMYMYRAMQEARRSIKDTNTGIRTWGAYQHYGNPYLQLFSGEDE